MHAMKAYSEVDSWLSWFLTSTLDKTSGQLPEQTALPSQSSPYNHCIVACMLSRAGVDDLK
jgi:hypothetical protein